MHPDTQSPEQMLIIFPNSVGQPGSHSGPGQLSWSLWSSGARWSATAALTHLGHVHHTVPRAPKQGDLRVG